MYSKMYMDKGFKEKPGKGKTCMEGGDEAEILFVYF